MILLVLHLFENTRILLNEFLSIHRLLQMFLRLLLLFCRCIFLQGNLHAKVIICFVGVWLRHIFSIVGFVIQIIVHVVLLVDDCVRPLHLLHGLPELLLESFNHQLRLLVELIETLKLVLAHLGHLLLHLYHGRSLLLPLLLGLVVG